MRKRSFMALFLAVSLALTMLPTGLALEPVENTQSLEQSAPVPAPAAEPDMSPSAVPVGAAFTLRYAQKVLGERTVTVTAEDPVALAAAADTLKLCFTMSYNSKVTRSYETEKAVSELTSQAPSFEVDLPFFGNWQVTASYEKDGRSAGSETSGSVALGVTECNIIAMNATLDTLIESVKFTTGKTEIEKKGMSGMDESIPTITALSRYEQFDWDKLPENLYPLPLLTDTQVRNGMNYSQQMDAMSQYVAELFAINPAMVFHFYINDVHLYVFPKLCYKNKIPANQYTLTLVTDGSGSYTTFRNAYTNQTVYSNTGAVDAADLHEKYVEQYLAFRQGVMDGKTEEYYADYAGGRQYYWTSAQHQEQSRISHCIYAILDAEDRAGCLKTEWWVVRRSSDTFGLNERDAAFQARVLSDTRISNNYINNCLVALGNADKTEAFKQLYHFDNSAFQQARDEGKKPLMLIGTSAWVENSLPPLHYIRMMQEFYGEEYAFFYKGHPGNFAMDSEANRKPYLDVGVQVLESSIAAELFEFYEPDLYCAGFSSSFFQNIGTERDLALWNWTKEVANANPDVKSYAGNMELFIAEATGTGEASTFLGDGAVYENPKRLRDAILELAEEDEQGDRLYLVQFQNTPDHTVAPYDSAVWNATKETLRYLSEAPDGSVAIARHTVRVTAPEGVTVTPSGETLECRSGDSLTLTITADAGCEITEILVDGKAVELQGSITLAKVRSDRSVEIRANGTAQPSATPSGRPNRPSTSHGSSGGSVASPSPSPAASPSPVPSASATAGPVALAPGETVEVKLEPVPDIMDTTPEFADAKAHWAKDAIAAMTRKGIFQGTDRGFQPDAPFDRSQLAAVLFRLSGSKAVDVTGSYRDVAAGAWYQDAVNWASVAGIMVGVGDNAFAPQTNVTREQVAVALYRYAQAAGLPTDSKADISSFLDASDVSDWATDAVSWCVSQGLLQGNPDGSLNPKGLATRAQAAAILLRFLPQG